ncbi:TPA: phage tail protein [Salmonella enterica subsp. enterica serovar Typhimurium]|uniref:phage tail protein n=2 Tax=Salmonella TaxID=590 RepID=UPI001315FACA|nr:MULTISPECIES: phage tail protein [Salmonella]ECM1822210.1 tail fiber protein [Salmonella enterica subsp. enterica serovar Typhimurium]MBJ5757805.1 tail fiber protein [Salmonella enterica subsp. enterica serovar Derby]MCL8766012.1 phage tail protein [Salmonella enterica subsp. enterica serovar Enteritidis]MCY4846443.1 phage tail protein [Salmonella enterica subsp. enterica serovar 1,4,[5],12:i:-]EDM2492612.1 phage tail protein [Salmonella enterica subsp. enterica serovar Typhimurium]
MAKNDFKAFATDRNANVMSQEEWEALPALLSGFTAGKASSAQVNKVIRQASFIAAALAQFVSDKTQRDVLDNGDLPGFVELLGSGFAVEYLSRKNPFGDIKSDDTVKTALENLGLGEGSALPIGVPVPWPSATPPTGWLKCNGAAFSAEEYPELAKAYPTNKLPDLRGEFIRGWDDGRGMDTGRAILSAQGDAIRNIYGEFKTVNTENYSIWESVGSFKGAVVPLNPSTNNSYFSLIRSMVTERTDGVVYPKVIGLDASRIVPTANENRPRNIAFNYIVRAA